MESERINLPKDKLIVTSINRYERKKGIAVGLKAIKLLKNQYGGKDLTERLDFLGCVYLQ